MEIIGYDGNRLKGNWTGGVRTKVQNSYITIPVLAAYKLNPRTTLKLLSLIHISEFGCRQRIAHGGAYVETANEQVTCCNGHTYQSPDVYKRQPPISQSRTLSQIPDVDCIYPQ